jgi:hypothetical protein
MIARILDSAMIYDFMGTDEVKSSYLCSIIKSEVEEIIRPLTETKLQDWEICFRFWYNNVKQILIYTKGKSYPLEKYKEITVHIPMPTKEKVKWGIDIEKHIYKDENHLDGLMKNFYSLEVEYIKFGNRQDYILDCMRRAIRFCFENGFTINWVKVKINL